MTWVKRGKRVTAVTTVVVSTGGISHLSEVEEAGENLPADVKTNIEKAISELEVSVKSDNKEEIEAQISKLVEASQKLMEMAQQNAQQAGASANASEDNTAKDDNVVDAEFEEVKEDETKK